MSTVIALYLIGTLLAALCAVVASFLFPSTLALAQEAASSAPGGIGEILQTLLNNAVSNPISAMAEANYIGVLLWAVVFGIALRDASDRTKQVLGDLSDALSTAIRWVISCAPFGILVLCSPRYLRPASPPSWTTAACSVSWRAVCSSWP